MLCVCAEVVHMHEVRVAALSGLPVSGIVSFSSLCKEHEERERWEKGVSQRRRRLLEQSAKIV